MYTFYDYLNKLKENHRVAVKIQWLNSDDTIAYDITNDYIDTSGTLSVNFQNGVRRTCDITLDNSNNKFPVDINNIWLGQKIKLYMGVYIDEYTPYYIPQGVFYITNPSRVYNPSTKTITLQCVDKWAFLDGTLFGVLDYIFQTPLNSNIYTAIRKLLLTSRIYDTENNPTGVIDPITPMLSSFYLDYNVDINITTGITQSTASTTVTLGSTASTVDNYYNGYSITIGNQTRTILDYVGSSKIATVSSTFGGITTGSSYIITNNVPIINTSYTARLERGKTYADILLEYATMLGAVIYYDANGVLCVEPSQEDMDDSQKEIIWNFKQDEKEYMGETLTYDFQSIYNNILVIGSILNGVQASAVVQNTNLQSDTCVQKIGLKTKVYEDSKYSSNIQCRDLGLYYLKKNTTMNKKVSVKCAPIYHMDVNKLITIDYPEENVLEKRFLVSGYTLPIGSTGEMSITATSTNDLIFS